MSRSAWMFSRSERLVKLEPPHRYPGDHRGMHRDPRPRDEFAALPSAPSQTKPSLCTPRHAPLFSSCNPCTSPRRCASAQPLAGPSSAAFLTRSRRLRCASSLCSATRCGGSRPSWPCWMPRRGASPAHSSSSPCTWANRSCSPSCPASRICARAQVPRASGCAHAPLGHLHACHFA